MNDTNPGEIRPEEAASILGCSVLELRRASDRGTVPVKRVTLGGHRRYDRAQIEARAAQLQPLRVTSCVVCGRPTPGQTTDERLPRWICPGQCTALWVEAVERRERGEFLPTIPAEREGGE